MPLRRAAPLALLVLLFASPAPGRETGAPAPPPPGGGTGEPAKSAIDSVLPRRCGLCHLDRAPAAAAGLIAFAPPGKTAGAGDAGICYSCHNGVLLDDRRTLWSGRHHPASGKVSCGSCHTPHVKAANVGPFMRYPRGSYGFCAECHAGRRSGAAGEHPAVAGEKGQAQDCGGCHVIHRAQGSGLIRADSAEGLCGACHGVNPSREGKGPGMTTHVTDKTGPPCLACHRVHKTVGGKMLLDKAALDGRLCRQCHERNFSAGSAEANHPVAPGQATCFSCHRMHNAEKPGARRGLLGAPWADVDGMCRRCHADLAIADVTEVWNHPLGVSAAGDERTLGARLARSGAVFAQGGRVLCLSCHRAHGGETGTPQLVTPREALCLYCHPEQNSLDTERAALGAHPVAVKPKRARIDKAFVQAGGRTGPGGELTCVTCHRAHRGSRGTPGLVLPRETYSCLLCHEREASVASTPHSTARAPKAVEGPGTAGLCGGCHGEHGWKLPPGEVSDGRTAIGRLCAACHGVGEEAGSFGGATNHPLGSELPPGRWAGGLPLFWKDGRRYRRGVITCATCHDVHRAGPDGRFLRNSVAGDGRDLCVSCHPREAVVAGTRHDLAQTRGSTCGPCHTVHDTFGFASWPTVRGGGDSSTVDLADFCGGCHRPEGLAAGSVVAERSHPALSPVGSKGGGTVGCVGCHDPHRWNPADGADRGSAAAGSAATSFLVRSAAGPAALCTGCHAAAAAVAGTPHDLSGTGAKGRVSAASASTDPGLCGACHRVHGAQPLAVATVPSSKPGEKVAAGPDPCTVCHAAGKIAAGATVDERGHPVGVSPGQDSGPDLPLFGSSGRREPRGRVTCSTCHDPHRWSPSGGSGATAKAATSFLRLSADGYAPLCFPCHAEKSMVVGTDHDLRVTAPAAVNSDGETAEKSGVCGACHAMHRAPAARALWSRGLGEGIDEGSRACASCHREGNELGARVPPRAEAHLVNYPGRGLQSRLFTVTGAGAPGGASIPVFDENGARADKGYLSCASCHDVHRWETDVSNSGSGVPVEGDITNSFLRVPATSLDRTMCAECHGDSLVEHYRNYHFPEGK